MGFSWKASQDGDGSTVQELQMGPFAHKISKTYKKIVLTLLECNHFIIIDDVAFGKQEFEKWKKLLQGYKVLYVGINAPIEIIQKREKSRGDRIIGSGLAQFRKVHEGISYDLNIDTHKESLESNVKTILSKLHA